MSAKRHLTDITVQKLPEGMWWDESTSAFGLRVGKKTRTFVCVRDGGRKITIGRYPSISLQEARKKAKGLLLGVYEKAQDQGYAEAVERYLRQIQPELRHKTWAEYQRILKSFSFTTTAVSPGEVAAALEQIPKASARTHGYVCLKIFFNWAMRHEYVESNPVSRVRRPRVAPARERVLEDHELKAIWHACEHVGLFGAMVRLLMVTGQRKGQFAALREDWVQWNKKRFVFPASVMKTAREHVVPLATLSEFLLRQLQPIGGYYFTAPGAIGQPFTAWSKSKIALDRHCDLDHWTLHDLRRTWSTNAARLDIPPHITERVLSHVAPEGKVAAIYNRFKYEADLRDAMERMSRFVMDLISE